MAKKTEAKSVKVRLVEGGKREVEGGGPVIEVPTVERSDKEWANRLTIEQFRVGRTHGTERAFCGVFHDTKKNGIYFCAGCGLPLFKSDDKFDSGTGWPSFFQPFAEENIGETTDNSYGMSRTEVEVVPAVELVEVPKEYEAKRFTPFWKKFGKEWGG